MRTQEKTANASRWCLVMEHKQRSVMEQGKDPRGLGRWAWMIYKGHSGVSLRYIAAYRPVLNKDRPPSVWSQQRTYFQQHNEDWCPRDMFTIDLCKEIERWLESGDQLILGVDANDDVCTGPFSRSLQTLGLVEVITN